jgi:hypothetical protein
LLQALSQIEYMIADGMLQLRLGTVGRADIPLDEIEQASPVLDYFGIRNREMLNTSFANRIGPGVLLNLTTRHTLEHSGRQFWSLYLTPSDPQQFIAALQVRIAATNSTSA